MVKIHLTREPWPWLPPYLRGPRNVLAACGLLAVIPLLIFCFLLMALALLAACALSSLWMRLRRWRAC